MGKLRSKKAVEPGWKFTNVFTDDIIFIDVRPFEAKISAGSFMSLGNRLTILVIKNALRMTR